jgi:predicted Zn-dependent peptidase
LDQHFPVALEILEDMFFESNFAEEEIEKEKKVVIEEIRMVEDTPDDLVHDLLSEVSLRNHPLSYPVIGTVENVQSFTRTDLIRYKEDFYRPQNVVISIAGNLPSDFLEQIKAVFSKHKGEDNSSKSKKPLFTPYVKIKQKATEQTHMCIGLSGLSVADERIYHLVLLNNVLGGNMSSRLFQEVREERGLAYSVYSYHSAHREAGLFAIYAGTKHGQEEEVCKLIREILYQVSENGILPSELAKAKEQLKASMMLGLESTNNRMSRLGRNELLLNKHLSLDEVIQNVEKISLADVNQVAQEIFSSPMSLALISPTGEVPTSFRGQSIV